MKRILVWITALMFLMVGGVVAAAEAVVTPKAEVKTEVTKVEPAKKTTKVKPAKKVDSTKKVPDTAKTTEPTKK